MRKSVANMMEFCSVYYETAFWRWKHIKSRTGFQLVPLHSIAFKRFIAAGVNYQRRLSQYSFYKIVLYYKSINFIGKMSFPQAMAHISRHSLDFLSDDHSNFPDTNKSSDYSSNISTFASGKLSKEELSSVNQVGAFEMLVCQLKAARYRRIAWSISAMITYSRQIGYFDNEKARLIEQINDLRFEKHNLLDDNSTLRHHNENLIDNLEKTNIEFQTLSLNLDNMRLVRMARVVSKMIEIPVAEAFFKICDCNLKINDSR